MSSLTKSTTRRPACSRALCTSVLSLTVVHSFNTSSHCFHHFHLRLRQMIFSYMQAQITCVLNRFFAPKRLALKRRRKYVAYQVFSMLLLHTYLPGSPIWNDLLLPLSSLHRCASFSYLKRSNPCGCVVC